jgi:hypothetical protein
VGANEVSLEFAELVAGDALTAERTEAGVDAVVREAVIEAGFDDGAGLADAVAGGICKGDWGVMSGDGEDVGESEGAGVQGDERVGHRG